MPMVYVSVGSNIRRRSSIKSGMRALYEEYGVLSVSSVYETDAVGFSGDPFYTFVVAFDTEDKPMQIQQVMKKIEINCGRKRDGRKYNPRTLDMDLLLYGNLQIESTSLQLPRDEIFKYAFVLEPLAELAPKLVCPGKNRSFRQLWKDYQRTRDWQPARIVDWDPVRANMLAEKTA